MDSEIDLRLLGGLKVEPDLQPLQHVAPNHGGVSQLQYPQQGVGKKDVKSKRKVAIKQENGGRKRTPMPAYKYVLSTPNNPFHNPSPHKAFTSQTLPFVIP